MKLHEIKQGVKKIITIKLSYIIPVLLKMGQECKNLLHSKICLNPQFACTADCRIVVKGI